MITFWFLAEHSIYVLNPLSLAYFWAVAAAIGDFWLLFNFSNSSSSSLRSLLGRNWEFYQIFFWNISEKTLFDYMMFIWKMQRQLDFLSYLGPYQHHWSVRLVMPNLKIVKMLKVPQYNELQWSKLVLKRLWPHLAILPQCFQSFPGPQRKSRREKRPAIAILFHFFSFSHFLTVFG